MSHLGSIPPGDPKQALLEADIRLKERELEGKRSLLTYSGKPLSRGAYVFQQLVVLSVIILGMIILYYFLVH